MPNQLAQFKRRASLAEHEAVLAALTEIARLEKTTVMELLRRAARETVKSRLADSSKAEAVRSVVWACAPVMPKHFKTPAQVARFKRQQREFDTVVMDMDLADQNEVQRRNAVVSSRKNVRVLNFADAASR
jgi:hypothetical protein